MGRAVIANALGPLENYRLVEHDPGAPGPGQVRIALKAAGLSFVDGLTARGEYQAKPPVPFIPGMEGAGVVEALGEGVNHVAIGDRVFCNGWGGFFADAIILPATSVKPLPETMNFAEGAVFPMAFYTAIHALQDRGKLQPDETLLVLGAAGATGYAALQLGKAMGARVIASCSTEDKRALCLAGGADAVVDARSENWRDDVKAANGGKGVDMVFDPVGGTATEPAFRALSWKGRHLVIGFPAGIASLRTNLPLLKGSSLVGVDIRQFSMYEPEKAAANVDQVCALAGEGKIKPVVGQVFTLEEWQAAIETAERGRVAGRVVIEMP
jgi:NADPH:quinone reductase